MVILKEFLLLLILMSMWIAGVSMEGRVDKITYELVEIKNTITQQAKEHHNLDTMEVNK